MESASVSLSRPETSLSPMTAHGRVPPGSRQADRDAVDPKRLTLHLNQRPQSGHRRLAGPRHQSNPEKVRAYPVDMLHPDVRSVPIHRTSNQLLSKWMNSARWQMSSSESRTRCTLRRTCCIPRGIHRSLRGTDCTPSETRCSPGETRCSPSGTDCFRSGTDSHRTPTGFTPSGTHSTWTGTRCLQSAITSPRREVSRPAGRSVW